MKPTTASRAGAGTRAGWLICGCIAIGGFVGSLAAAHAIRGLETRTIEAAFRLDARERELVIRHGIDETTHAVQALSGLYAASVEVDAREFQTFVAAELAHNQSVSAMGWNPVVPHAERDAFVARARSEGVADFRITERAANGDMVDAAVAREYVVVRFIEPYEGHESALGFNVASERRRLEALSRARDTGTLAITAPIQLVQAHERDSGFLGFVPYYGGARPDTVQDRRAAIRGYLVAVFDSGTIVDTALRKFDPAAIEVTMFDVSDADADTRPTLLARDGAATSPGERGPESFTHAARFDVGGRRWELRLAPTDAYVSRRRTAAPTAALAAGWIITALLTAYLLLSQRGAVERERAKRALERSEARLRLVVDAVADGAWDWNLVTGEVHFSDTWLAGLGYEREDVEGHVRFWESLVHPDDMPRLKAVLDDHLNGRTDVYECENRLRTKSGTYRWNLDRGRVVERDLAGAPVRMVGTDTNIDARKRAEEETRRLEERVRHTQKLESLGVLAGGIAHDFNNLLVAVLGSADLVLMQMPEDAPDRRHLERIKTAGARAAELTQQMLAYAGQGRLVVQHIDLTELVREMLSLLSASISKKAQLTCVFSDTAPSVEGDATQLRQVVMNLITNAAEALENRAGDIHVRTGIESADAERLRPLHRGDDCVPGEYAFVEVSDTGIGMDAQTRERMFDPFYSTKFQGRGLGLAAVIGIVSSHAGAIDLTTQVGVGTTIRVLLPRAHPRTVPTTQTEERRTSWRTTGTALVVDDEDPVRELARELLTTCGFDVLTAVDGVAAVEMVRAHPGKLDLVLLDLSMPRMGGRGAFREIRALAPNLPVVFSSGAAESASLRALTDQERVGFLRKPYVVAEFVDCIRSAVES